MLYGCSDHVKGSMASQVLGLAFQMDFCMARQYEWDPFCAQTSMITLSCIVSNLAVMQAL